MRLYHGTTEAAADAILSGGWRDSPPAPFQLELNVVGVWLSTSRLHYSGAMLAVDVPDDVAERYELVGDIVPAWIIPAEVLNRYPVEVVEDV